MKNPKIKYSILQKFYEQNQTKKARNKTNKFFARFAVNKIFRLRFFLFFILLPFSQSALAWSGYDFEGKTEVEIQTGELVREGLVIQFYDLSDDQYHSGKVLYMESVPEGTRIQIEDMDIGQERIFIMN